MKTITDGNYAADLALSANTPPETYSLLHSLEQVSKGIGLDFNTDKTEFLSFNQDGAISSLNPKSLKFVDQLIYLDSSISSTESDVNICII